MTTTIKSAVAGAIKAPSAGRRVSVSQSFDPAVVAEVSRLYLGGMGQREIAQAMGFSAGLVFNILKRNGVKRPDGIRDIMGEKFGRLTVLEFSHKDERHRKHFVCVCECGTRKTVQRGLLTGGNTRSCGCLQDEFKRSNRNIPDHGAAVNAILQSYKANAAKRGLEWLIDDDLAKEILRQPCHYCGVRAGNYKKGRLFKPGFHYNGIDRADSCLGYLAANVVPCCGQCNWAKSTTPKSEFIAWAIRIARQHGACAEPTRQINNLRNAVSVAIKAGADRSTINVGAWADTFGVAKADAENAWAIALAKVPPNSGGDDMGEGK